MFKGIAKIKQIVSVVDRVGTILTVITKDFEATFQKCADIWNGVKDSKTVNS